VLQHALRAHLHRNAHCVPFGACWGVCFGGVRSVLSVFFLLFLYFHTGASRASLCDVYTYARLPCAWVCVVCVQGTSHWREVYALLQSAAVPGTLR
jgi:hypothetical protein